VCAIDTVGKGQKQAIYAMHFPVEKSAHGICL
jgi:hypothetical protein